jgi:hypothetical protein
MTPKAASKAAVFGGLPTDMQPLPVLAELVGLHHNTALSGLSWGWTSRFGDPHTINSSVRSLDTHRKDRHTAHLLETEILPPLDDKFAQVHLGRITLRGYS